MSNAVKYKKWGGGGGGPFCSKFLLMGGGGGAPSFCSKFLLKFSGIIVF